MGIMERIDKIDAQPVPSFGLPSARGLTFEEFEDMCSRLRPDVKLQLIEGLAILVNPPSHMHNLIGSNLCWLMNSVFRSHNVNLRALQEVGVRVPGVEGFAAIADIAVTSGTAEEGSYPARIHFAAEVLSPSNTNFEMDSKRARYAEHPHIEHVVFIAHHTVRAVQLDRSDGWREQVLDGPSARLRLSAFDLDLPLGDLYEGTKLAEART